MASVPGSLGAKQVGHVVSLPPVVCRRAWMWRWTTTLARPPPTVPLQTTPVSQNCRDARVSPPMIPLDRANEHTSSDAWPSTSATGVLADPTDPGNARFAQDGVKEAHDQDGCDCPPLVQCPLRSNESKSDDNDSASNDDQCVFENGPNSSEDFKELCVLPQSLHVQFQPAQILPKPASAATGPVPQPNPSQSVTMAIIAHSALTSQPSSVSPIILWAFLLLAMSCFNALQCALQPSVGPSKVPTFACSPTREPPSKPKFFNSFLTVSVLSARTTSNQSQLIGSAS